MHYIPKPHRKDGVKYIFVFQDNEMEVSCAVDLMAPLESS